MRSFAALRKEAGLFCGSLLRKGEVFAYVGRNQNLKDLKANSPPPFRTSPGAPSKESSLLVRIHFIIVMMSWTGLAPWEFEFPLAMSQSI